MGERVGKLFENAADGMLRVRLRIEQLVLMFERRGGLVFGWLVVDVIDYEYWRWSLLLL